MKQSGKQGKRKGPTGYRVPSTFLHTKARQNQELKRKVWRKQGK